MQMLKDFSVSTVMAGAVTVLVGFTTSVAIVFQAAYASGAGTAGAASWIWALGLGMGVTCIALSLQFRIPVVTAWSTAGAAMLITSAPAFSAGEVVGAFVAASALTVWVGFGGIFQRFMHRVPLPLAAGMLAGVLLRIGLDVFVVMGSQWQMPLLMTLVYLFAQRLSPRYSVLFALAAGVVWAFAMDQVHLAEVDWQWAYPVWVTPVWSVASLFSLALPLFVITMASQNIPGVASMVANGYRLSLSPVIGWIGVINILLAPFGAFALNLAAITASICAGPQAHQHPSKRYTASVSAGVFYILAGLAGASVVSLFAAFPKALVMVVAGLSLFGTISNAMAAAMQESASRQAAFITFAVTASGLSFWGVGAPFWGLVAGALAMLLAPAQD
ncbi:MAG: benzoate transporter BenE [Betaproteobacteria bacterium]|jgi:benzoate membrane transport protein|nr:benzoate transporter BenE [Betaproteobacteria bacterium]